MKKTSTASPVTGTLFIESAPVKDRRSLSASLRGGHYPVSGITAAFAAAPIDSPSAGEVAICAPATLRLAEDLFERWNEALRSGNAQRVSTCYTENAVLLPTVSNLPRLSRSEIQEYFEHFLQKKPLGKVNQRIFVGGKSEHVPARYTFVYENRDGEWLIAHHHSSLMP